MTFRTSNVPVKFDERGVGFAIYHLIDDCPIHTVVGELVRNAVENVVLAQGSPGKIEFFSEEVEGVPKLGLYNEGPGMSPADLERLMNMAASGKEIGTDKNY